MNDILIDMTTGKKCTFSNYFVIYGDVMFKTNNFNFEENLSNCYYVKVLGSSSRPKIYANVKEDGAWTLKNGVIGGYDSLAEFVYNNQDAFICIRGFSRASILHFIRLVNETKGTNIKFVKFKNNSSILENSSSMSPAASKQFVKKGNVIRKKIIYTK